jgi:hypothetical protein
MCKNFLNKIVDGPRTQQLRSCQASAPDAPRRRNRRSACQSLRPPRPPPPPPLPCASQRGVEEAAAHDQQLDQHHAAATSIRHRDSNQHWRSSALPLRAVEQALPIPTSAAQPARQANACHAGCFRSFHIERPTASRPPTRVSKRTPAERRAPPGPLRSGAFTMQQSRQPPFNPTGWHACCNHWNAPCHFAPEKTKLVN